MGRFVPVIAALLTFAIHLVANAHTLAQTFSARYAISYERSIPIMLCRGRKLPLAQFWPEFKKYI